MKKWIISLGVMGIYLCQGFTADVSPTQPSEAKPETNAEEVVDEDTVSFEEESDYEDSDEDAL